MDPDESVTQWINELQEGDQDAAKQLWERYFSQLVRLAGSKLPPGRRRDFDEEDVALSAFCSFCTGLKQGRFPDLQDRESLWSLLLVITSRKAMHRLRSAKAQKRGGGRVEGESVFHSNDDSAPDGINQIIGNAPTGQFLAELAEESDRLLALLPDVSMSTLALLKMEGYSNKEVAEKLGCGLRTVERRIQLIRQIWSERG